MVRMESQQYVAKDVGVEGRLEKVGVGNDVDDLVGRF